MRNFGFAEVTITRKNRTKTRFCLVFRSLNRNSGFAEVTHVRKNSNKFGFSLT